MLIGHAFEEGVLHLSLPGDLALTSRSAADLEAQALALAHRPRLVRVQLSTADPSPASLSVLSRVRRFCENVRIPLTVVGPAPAPVAVAAAPHQE
ncbi:hypothetical protein ACFFSH_12565 [Streptomyces filamentosus]|uniref:STAS domain-containing protein n=1 Tax=Streptomyces filamentosus TaxID=67294 RepID=A0A919BWB6_STRFL|nr:hypothetical protein [Streptomyces filamentosus]GHG26667.1 hypothetical protein GCM10017667_73980 [Streptomyces filamentosus]